MPRRSGRRSDYTWAHFGGLITAHDLGTTSAAGGNATFSVALTSTIMRLRGRVFAQLDAGGVDERARVMCGVALVKTEGVGEIPELETAGSDEGDWLWTGSLFVSSGAEAAVVSDGLFDRIDVDTRAMRRVKGAQDSLIFAIQTPAVTTVDATGTVDVIYGLRVLQAL